MSTIKAAYPDNLAPGLVSKPHGHDLRGVSASWAKFHNARLSDILEAAAWKSQSTFTSCYMKDVFQAEVSFGVKVISASAKAAKDSSK